MRTHPKLTEAVEGLVKDYESKFRTIVPTTVKSYFKTSSIASLEDLLTGALERGKPVSAWERYLQTTLQARENGDTLMPYEHEDLRQLDLLRNEG